VSSSVSFLRFALIGGVASMCAAPAATAADQAATESAQLEEIVVTAQKREQSLNDVGLSVAVIGEDFLKTRQIASFQDLTTAVPSLNYADSPSGAPMISLRGIGVNETSLSAYPAVSLYMDQIPLTFPVMASHTSFDLERVEVLQGPQGTVFGQNVTGGAINFIAAKPTPDFTAGVTLGGGRFNRFNAEGFISGPIGERAAARVSGRFERADGWQQSMTRPGDKNGEVRAAAARILVDFHPTDDATLELNLNGWKDTGDSLAPQLIGTNVQVPGFLNPAVANAPLAPEKPRAADWTSDLPERDNRFLQASLRADIRFAGDITLTSITSYADYDQEERNDFDGLPVPQEDYSVNDGKIKDFAQELRLANGSDRRFRWMLGANYNHSSVDQLFHYEWGAASTAAFVGSFFETPTGNWFGTEQKLRTYAAFTNLEFDVSDALTLKAGLRHTKYRARTNNCGTDLTPPYTVGRLFYDIFAGGTAGPYDVGDCFAFNDLGATINGVSPGLPGRFIGSFKEHNTPWRAGLDWKLDGDSLVYANVTKGYKAGYFGTIGASVWSQYKPVVQESVLSYEAGFKLTRFDRRLQLNGAVFYYDYKDKQLRSRNIDPFWGNLDVIQNVPKSSATGAELSLIAKPIPQLTLSANATYIKAEIDEFSGVSASGVAADFGNTPMPFSPEWSLNFNGDFVTPIAGDKRLIAGASISYRSSTAAITGGETNPPLALPIGESLFRIDSYALVNLHAGIETDRWRAVVWGKNVFNAYYWNNVIPAFDTLDRYAGMPATYGVTLSYRFE